MKKGILKTNSMWAFLVVVVFLLSTTAFSVPYELYYSGRMTTSVGAPVEGPLNIDVNFFRTEVGGTEIAVDISTFTNVTLDEGVFTISIELSPSDFHAVFSDSAPVWIEIIDVTNNRTYPRQVISSVPYALKVPVDNATIGYNTDGKLTVKNSAEAGAAMVAAINSSSGTTLGTGSLPNLSGDVSGTITNASVDKIKGRTISDQSPSNGEFLSWDGSSSSWKPAAIVGSSGGTVTQIATGTGLTGGPITASGTISVASGGISETELASNAVTTVKITDANVTSAKIASGVDAAKIGGGTVSSTEFGYLDGVTSAIQTQFFGKQASITSTSDIVAGSLTSAKQNAVNIAPFNTAAGNTGELRFGELAANGTNYIGFKAPDFLTADKVWTLPSADGTSGQVLKTNGSGVLSWADEASALVTSVNTLTGAVTLTTSNVSEGTNFYYTDSRAKTAAVGDAITDAVTDKAPSQNAVFDALALKSATSHNHSGVYEPAGLSTDVVTTTKIFNGAVTSAKIANLGIETANINTGAVTAAKIAACSDTQILKMSGVNWVCSSDATNSGGTVTSVASGTGLTGGPITGTGTLSLATSGVTPGTYTKVTVDNFGRTTLGTMLMQNDLPNSIDATKIGAGAISNTEFGYLDGVTSAIQTQLNGQVAGPASATDNAIVRFDGTTGKLVQNSGMMIDDSGNVGIGTTNPAQKLQLGSSGDGSVALANSWNTFSDIRLKRDLVKIPDALDKLLGLNGYYYYWKKGGDQGRQVGVIAQEVEEVLPELVKTGSDGIKTVDYPKITAVLIEATKKIKADGDQLKVENLQFKADSTEKDAAIEQLKTDNDAMKAVLCEIRPGASFCGK